MNCSCAASCWESEPTRCWTRSHRSTRDAEELDQTVAFASESEQVGFRGRTVTRPDSRSWVWPLVVRSGLPLEAAKLVRAKVDPVAQPPAPVEVVKSADGLTD